jgi:beta-mannosidase
VVGEETTGIGNYRHSTVQSVELHTIYDAPAPATGWLRWDLFHLDGRLLLAGKQRVALRYGESRRQRTLDLSRLLTRHGRERVYLRVALVVDGTTVSEDTVFLTAPRFVALPKAATRVAVRVLTPTCALLTFRSPVFQHRFAFDLPGHAHRASDNYFELYPGEAKEVRVEFERPVTKIRIQQRLRHLSLVDTYAPAG